MEKKEKCNKVLIFATHEFEYKNGNFFVCIQNDHIICQNNLKSKFKSTNNV